MKMPHFISTNQLTFTDFTLVTRHLPVGLLTVVGRLLHNESKWIQQPIFIGCMLDAC